MAGPRALSLRPPWEGRKVVLGVTGGIAAYKAVQVARDLTRLGALVDVVLTRSAEEFVRPLSFEGVTGRSVLTSLWSAEGSARHLTLAGEADLVLVAPATADFLARASQGRGDDLLTTLLLATRAPVLLAPAMNDRMWSHPQTVRNAHHCREVLGYRLVGPRDGPLAAGEGAGPGRMLEPDELVEWSGRLLGAVSPWSSIQVLVTAGPTREPLDAVRYVGNRSSGRMGFAVAREAWLRGSEVTLVTGPSALPDPVGVTVRRVETAREMRDAVMEVAPRANLSVFAAAVADFRPQDPSREKQKRKDTGSEWAIRLVENPDVAGESRSVRPPGSVAVGFALETGELISRAREKLEAKGFDLIVANDAGEEGAGFDVTTNRVTLLDREGGAEALPLMGKEEVARVILDRVESHLPSTSNGDDS
ncbi:MAG: bifunctional phosphopantothenoylcysteine decarboxylase/phosphopantothenate--cysteine ligase CoaBC [Gemmatimonadales bacterium]|nr:MAG: bifunctional phosphopantothenoylcysteine decarboxylase/phosphopantothenate--cysteine ligase CoaBC [Gemmatimonadales bacterium]